MLVGSDGNDNVEASDSDIYIVWVEYLCTGICLMAVKLLSLVNRCFAPLKLEDGSRVFKAGYAA
jgi:hypothetical protein